VTFRHLRNLGMSALGAVLFVAIRLTHPFLQHATYWHKDIGDGYWCATCLKWYKN
jgi:hypothetical protein